MQTAAPSDMKSAWLSYFSLFTSFGTLLCCAFPSLLVLLGLGATVASLLSAMPWLVWLSRHKHWTFSIAGLLILLSFVMTYYASPRLRNEAECEADDPSQCVNASHFSRVLLWISAAIYATGFFVAYGLGPILTRLD